jgi:hypothetical protein
MYTLEDFLKDDNIKISDLLRIIYSYKQCLYIEINVFNIGAYYKFILTNDYYKYSRKIESYSYNGYDQFLNLDDGGETIEYFIQECCRRYENISTDWSKVCYDYSTFEDYCKKVYKLSVYNLKRLKKLYDENSNRY